MHYAERSVLFPGRGVPLHAMISSCGCARESKPTYDWDGLKRGRTEFALLQYTTAGRGVLRFEKDRFDILPGHAMILHLPHDNHYWLPADSPEWEFVYVCLHGSEVIRIWRDIVARVGPVVSLDEKSPVVVTMHEIVSAVVRERIITPFDASRMAWDLTMRLASVTLGSPAGDQRPEGIDNAMILARDGVGAQITVDDMAQAAGYSRYHFTRIFTASEGMPPGEFIRHQRLRHAVTLLQTTRKPVKEIAIECGFYDATYFGKVFQKSMGVTPRGFRKSGMY